MPLQDSIRIDDHFQVRTSILILGSFFSHVDLHRLVLALQPHTMVAILIYRVVIGLQVGIDVFLEFTHSICFALATTGAVASFVELLLRILLKLERLALRGRSIHRLLAGFDTDLVTPPVNGHR